MDASELLRIARGLARLFAQPDARGFLLERRFPDSVLRLHAAATADPRWATAESDAERAEVVLAILESDSRLRSALEADHDAGRLGLGDGGEQDHELELDGEDRAMPGARDRGDRVARAMAAPMPRAPEPRAAAARAASQTGARAPDVLAHALAQMPRQSQVGTEVEVSFSLTRERLQPDAGMASDDAVVAIDPELPVTASISARGYRLASGVRRSRTMRLPAPGARPAVRRFRLVAVDPGPGEVTIVVRQRDEFPLASVRMTSTIVVGEVTAEPVTATADAVPPDPDLTALPSIRVDESIAGNVSMIDIAVQVGDERRQCSRRIADKVGFIALTFQRIAGLRARLATERGSADERLQMTLTELRSIGVGLSQSLFSAEVRTFLWDHLDQLRHVVIQTTGEFDIPWELIYLCDPSAAADGQELDVERFLGMRGVTRSVYNTATVAPTAVHVRPGRARYLCPSYRDRGLALTHTRDEALFMRQTYRAKIVRPGDAAAMSQVISSGFDLLHFAGHGVWTASEPPDQRLLLAGYRTSGATPRGSSYSASDLRRDLPDPSDESGQSDAAMVFLNACDVGRLDTSVTGLGGFPEAFLRGGVGVLIGCSWLVDDRTAAAFARDFYDSLNHRDIASAVDAARRKALAKADLSWLAYVAYAHPHATVALPRATEPEEPDMNPTPASAPLASDAARGSTTLTPAELAALKPHVITLTDGRLDKEATPEPRSVADYATVEADLDAIFTTHLPKFVEEHEPGPVPIVLYAHGGLVDEEAGFAIAKQQVDWWKANGVYPIHFVWKTGIGDALADAIVRWVSGGSRGWFEEAKDRLIESAARLLGGQGIWLDMKLDAAASSDASGGARKLVDRLAKWMKANPDRVQVHAVGHSAGSIFHSHLIPVALRAGVPSFETVSFLAPAVRVDAFTSTLTPVADRIRKLTIFTMTDEAERDDTCLNVYGKSLLYLISAALEAQPGAPILGLARSIAADAQLRAFLSSGGREVVSSPNRKTGRSASTATSHGGFDNDRATMESVLLRITDLDAATKPFPGSARSIDPWADVIRPEPSRPRGVAGGAKAALCVGIDAYRRPSDVLKGAVSDSTLWGGVLQDAGFQVTALVNGDATRESIMGSLFQLATSAAAGDVLAFQYSGHGTFAPDPDGDEADEADPQDEALCPVDFRTGQLILDDDLALIWDLIPDGVTLTMFLDCCHAGGGNRGGTLDGGSLPRGVTLTRSDMKKFKIARGRVATDGKHRALDLVSEAETAEVDVAVPIRRPEALFAACRSDQLAWETNGQGDFTGFVAPMLAAHIGRTSNRDFFDRVVAGFDSRRQDPTFTAEIRLDVAPLLATGFADDTTQALQPQAVGEAARALAPRDAALAAILRGVADLLAP